MQINSIPIADTFAEGFTMRYCRMVVTAHDQHWLDMATRALCGYGTSVIGCDAEVAVEGAFPETLDGRPGVSVLMFAFSYDDLAKVVPNRVGQCLLTCPTTAVFDGFLDAEHRVPMGKRVRYFGDGFQKSKLIDQRRFWRVPVMEGEFLVEEEIGAAKGVAGGNFVIQAAALETALSAARAAVEAVAPLPHVITPFPGGVARSGSKVGSRYDMVASTADAFRPTLRGRVESELHPNANVALEIVVNGTQKSAVDQALVIAIHAATQHEIVAISAGNYGGQLGKHHFHLHQLLA